MTFLPTFRTLTGEGKPRVLVVKAVDTYGSGALATVFTATSVTMTGFTAGGLVNVVIGMRVLAIRSGDAISPFEVYGRVNAVDDTNGIIGVDEWVGGIPTANSVVAVNGWVVDLPYCRELTEGFREDVNVHHLWRSRKKVKHFGWGYKAVLDYSQHIKADALMEMDPMMNLSEDDELVLIPRVDDPTANYRVFYDGEIVMSRYPRSGGYRKVAIPFAGIENVAFPIPTSGYGFGYGEDYGYQF